MASSSIKPKKDVDFIVYEFSVSGFNLTGKVTDLTIKTFHDDLVFEGALSNNEGEQIKNAYLVSDQVLRSMKLRSAVGTINGEKKDVSSMIRVVRQITPIPITDGMNVGMEFATCNY